MPLSIPTAGGRGFAERYMDLGNLILSLQSRAIAQQKALEAIAQITKYLSEPKEGEKPEIELTPEQRTMFRGLVEPLKSIARMPLEPKEYANVATAAQAMMQLIFDNIAKRKFIEEYSKLNTIFNEFTKKIEEMFPEEETIKDENLKLLAQNAKTIINLFGNYFNQAVDIYKKLGNFLNVDVNLLTKGFDDFNQLVNEGIKTINNLVFYKAQLQQMKHGQRLELEKMKQEQRGKISEEILKLNEELNKNIQEFIEVYTRFKGDVSRLYKPSQQLQKSVQLPELKPNKPIDELVRDINEIMGNIFVGSSDGVFRINYGGDNLINLDFTGLSMHANDINKINSDWAKINRLYYAISNIYQRLNDLLKIQQSPQARPQQQKQETQTQQTKKSINEQASEQLQQKKAQQK